MRRERLINPVYRIKWRPSKIDLEGAEEETEVAFEHQLLTQAISELLVRNVPVCFNDEFPYIEEISLVLYRKDEP